MKLLDANLLLYAYNKAAPQHVRARQWLEAVFVETEAIGLPWVSVLTFLRISTDLRILPRPYTSTEAIAIVQVWLAQPRTQLVGPTELHWDVLQQVVKQGQARGALVSDAHLAALALERGATLCSTDRDFRRFPGLKLLNPLD
ncbi:MAG: TA system VapC family ribonuclease toxin [Terriglobales bacterium]